MKGMRQMFIFCDYANFYGEELSVPYPTPKLKDNPLSAARDWLFNIFAATFHTGGCSSIHNSGTCHAMVTVTHLSRVWDFDAHNEEGL